jgi:hypothetical protein
VSLATFEGERPAFVEEGVPDVAFLLVDTRGTPKLAFSTVPVRHGEMVAYAGFPMGERMLRGYVGLRGVAKSSLGNRERHLAEPPCPDAVRFHD